MPSEVSPVGHARSLPYGGRSPLAAATTGDVAPGPVTEPLLPLLVVIATALNVVSLKLLTSGGSAMGVPVLSVKSSRTAAREKMSPYAWVLYVPPGIVGPPLGVGGVIVKNS